ncbi:hypothetical protein PhaeoP30_02496 [Phaeobacter inhibens]|uniref:YaaC family protein n=1 Tax=Phaeobacter inhibens TaxID=221822 RepID=UPI000CA2723D|nr:YaaC family protein [Phaeobacter inhibens]AUQ59388.1 hypothetical protein PhaeoP30_02496 [Phaeobacter inhibens]
MTVALKLNGRRLWMHKGIASPDFTKEHVLSRDPWLYVELWLKREKASESLSYWQQAKRFADASNGMPTEAAPLTIYYSFLNASKALLTYKKATFSQHHGVAGVRPENARAALSTEIVHLKGGGILPELCRYLGESVGNSEHSLSDILWNIPFIHRAYCLTYHSKGELFIPLEEVRYVKSSTAEECWLEAQIVPRFSDKRKLLSIPSSFEYFERDGNTFVRRKKRFRWFGGRSNATKRKEAHQRLVRYHSTLRRIVVNINGNRDLWYLKRASDQNSAAERHTLVLMFAAMHRLSELSRYDPNGLDRHLSGKANWLISEFVHGAMDQFIDQIATEITGCQFWQPKIR